MEERRVVMYDQSSDSILNTVKDLIGTSLEDDSFDQEIMVHINAVFLTLQQLGVGPKEGFAIFDSESIWSEFIPDGTLQNQIKSYMYLKVKLLFDPPTNSTAVESFQRIANEYEFRINLAAEEIAKGS